MPPSTSLGKCQARTITEQPTAATKQAPTAATARRQLGRGDEGEGDRDRGGGGRVAAGEGDRPELVVAEDGLEARVGEHDLEHLRGQVGAGDDDHRGGGVERAPAPERDPAGGGQHRQQRQRVAEVGDRGRRASPTASLRGR